MTPQDQEIIHQWAAKHPTPTKAPTIILATGRDDGPGKAFKQFCEDVTHLIPDIRLKRDGEHASESPAVLVGHHGNIAFQIIPTGKWLSYFLNAVSEPDQDRLKLSPQITQRLAQIQLPLTVNLYVSHHCPHCPAVTNQLLPLAQASHRLHLNLIDVALFPEPAQKDQVRAVPTLIMEDQFRWTGPINVEEVLDWAIQQDPTKLSAASLRQFLEGGQAQQAAEMMIEHGGVFPALMDLLTDAKWSVRLSAMVTVECLAEDASALAQDLIDPLWDRFSHCPAAVKGDLAYVLGVINSEKAREKLRAIATQEADAQVKEAALEALEENNSDTAATPM